MKGNYIPLEGVECQRIATYFKIILCGLGPMTYISYTSLKVMDRSGYGLIFLIMVP